MRAPQDSRRPLARSVGPTLAGVAAAVSCLFGAGVVRAADEPPQERPITTDEISSWLDSNGPKPGTDASANDEELAPPPPPRHKGFVVESSIGVFGQLGTMKNVSPLAPWFRLQFGFEPLKWLMAFAETDLMVANTSYAPQPPPPRTYALYGFGGGLRFTVKPSDRVGLYLQASIGAAAVNNDVLRVYGYQNANSLNLYEAGELGVEWYQVDPHLALALHGGLRSYAAGFERQFSTQTALAWVSGIALRYTF
jgi:hypothetical protein